MSSSGSYSLSGTIGQGEATPLPLTGGSYSLNGGFWSAVTVVPVEGLPPVSIFREGGSVVLSWSASNQPLVLQMTMDLKAACEPPFP